MAGRSLVCGGLASVNGHVAGRTPNFTRRWFVDRPEQNDRSEPTVCSTSSALSGSCAFCGRLLCTVKSHRSHDRRICVHVILQKRHTRHRFNVRMMQRVAEERRTRLIIFDDNFSTHYTRNKDHNLPQRDNNTIRRYQQPCARHV